MKKILLLAFTATVMLGACKKDKGGDEPETVPTCAMVKTVERWGSSEDIDTDVVKFDEQGRVVKDGDNTYEYSSGKITVTENYSGGSQYITEYTLDGQGRVITSKYSGTDTEYKYNNDGYLIERKSGDYTTAYEWQNGNLVKIVSTSIYNGTSQEVYSSTITYGNDTINDKLIAGVIFGEMYAEWHLSAYFGKQPKNAPVMEKEKNSGPETTNIYFYVKDSKNKVIGYTETKDGEISPWWEYTVDYNCK